MMSIADQLITSTQNLSKQVETFRFSDPVTHIYNPLNYAWDSHKSYIEKRGSSKKKVLFMGMNPGPYGMAQTGIPFGEIQHVKDWVGVSSPVGKPDIEHPKRMIEGFNCKKSEVSGRRLWGFLKEQFSSADAFFEDHYVLNYCPLVFMEASGKNRTPDKLPVSESEPLYQVCNEHLLDVVNILEVDWIVGVGGFAEQKARDSLKGNSAIKIGRILHPSPASPLANRGWGPQALAQLEALGIWS